MRQEGMHTLMKARTRCSSCKTHSHCRSPRSLLIKRKLSTNCAAPRSRATSLTGNGGNRAHAHRLLAAHAQSMTPPGRRPAPPCPGCRSRNHFRRRPRRGGSGAAPLRPGPARSRPSMPGRAAPHSPPAPHRPHARFPLRGRPVAPTLPPPRRRAPAGT